MYISLKQTFEDFKEVNESFKSKRDRRYNGPMKKGTDDTMAQ